ncbi:hypothetical protein D4A39_08675 [Alcanivorax profundi]|uniref:J domain-containing protein n=1 Tax=Alcanivorax profundi TaxID=2338368 RepID=A0A418XZT3_9GAMM|nr:J domain-containing protein [Alcanivorax profundi]RJG18530.1 hypothetical protein D4A39_08675 [Alcanivorax profundi]
MDRWGILELEPTSDARAIKRAYARQLKQTRPDEQPEAFQRLHEAYKQALAHAARQSSAQQPCAAPLGEQNTTPETLASWTLTLSDTTTTGSDTVQTETQQAEDILAPLLQRCEALMAEHHGARQPQYWNFLLQQPLFLDDDCHRRFARRLFDLIIAHEAAILGGDTRRTPMSPAVLFSLDNLFFWSSLEADAFRGHDRVMLESLFSRIDDAQQTQPFAGVRGGKKRIAHQPLVSHPSEFALANPLLRGLAMVVDVVMLGLVLKSLFNISWVDTHFSHLRPQGDDMLLLIPIYLLFAALCELSPLRAAPAPWLFGLRVMTRTFKPVTLRHVLRRAAFLLCLPLMLYLNQWALGLNTLVLLVMFINLFLQGDLLQDRFSGTRIINWPETRNRQRERRG